MKTHPRVIKLADWTKMERRRRSRELQQKVTAVCFGVITAAVALRILVLFVTGH